jgi:hypothetical protein
MIGRRTRAQVRGQLAFGSLRVPDFELVDTPVMVHCGSCTDPREAALIADLMYMWRANRYGEGKLVEEDLNFRNGDLERHSTLLTALRACSRVVEVQAMLRTLSRAGVLCGMLEPASPG